MNTDKQRDYLKNTSEEQLKKLQKLRQDKEAAKKEYSFHQEVPLILTADSVYYNGKPVEEITTYLTNL